MATVCSKPSFVCSFFIWDLKLRSRESVNLKHFELARSTWTYHWGLEWIWQFKQHSPETHHSSRIMRTYHTHFGEPLGIAPGWWDDRNRNHKPVLPIYLRSDISNVLSRALSCLRLYGHNFLVQRMRHNRNRRPHELRICEREKTPLVVMTQPAGSVTNMTGTLFRMRNTFCWAVRMHILLAFAHSTASWSSHLSMRIAQLVWGLFWTNHIYLWCSLFCGWVPSPFPWFFLVPFWFGFKPFPSFRSKAPQRHI